VVKCAGDMALLGLLKYGANESNKSSEKTIKSLTEWRDNLQLIFNVSNTKEMVTNFSRVNQMTDPISINGSRVERVRSFKSLDTVCNEKANF